MLVTPTSPQRPRVSPAEAELIGQLRANRRSRGTLTAVLIVLTVLGLVVGIGATILFSAPKETTDSRCTNCNHRFFIFDLLEPRDPWGPPAIYRCPRCGHQDTAQNFRARHGPMRLLKRWWEP